MQATGAVALVPVHGKGNDSAWQVLAVWLAQATCCILCSMHSSVRDGQEPHLIMWLPRDRPHMPPTTHAP